MCQGRAESERDNRTLGVKGGRTRIHTLHCIHAWVIIIIMTVAVVLVNGSVARDHARRAREWVCCLCDLDEAIAHPVLDRVVMIGF